VFVQRHRHREDPLQEGCSAATLGAFVFASTTPIIGIGAVIRTPVGRLVGSDHGRWARTRSEGRAQRAGDDLIRRALLPPPFGARHGEPKRRGAGGD
jgi:hypothetical protein